MKKNVLALSITAALGLVSVGGAHAITGAMAGSTANSLLALNEAGTGHSLFVPYFTAQDKNSTLINLVNTDLINGKAVKIRFRGASNSDDLFDFQVFLSPGDVWTANISQGADGLAKLTTSDASCTKPAKAVLNATPFRTTRLDTANLVGDALAAGTREGYVEIFNMADIPKMVSAGAATSEAFLHAAHALNSAGSNFAGVTGLTGATLATPTNVNALYTAIKHVGGAAPCAMAVDTVGGDAFALLDSLNVTTYSGKGIAAVGVPAAAAPSADFGLLPPSSGLMANWTIINVVGAAAWAGSATAIQSVTAPTVADQAATAALGNVAYWPQTGGPAGTPNFYTADPLLRTANAYKTDAASVANTPYAGTVTIQGTAAVAALNVDLPDMSTPYSSAAPATALGPLAQTLSLTWALQTSQIINEYLTDPTISATTDWVFSSPTRRYQTAFHYGATINTTAGASYEDGRRFTDLTGVVAGTAAAPTIGFFLPGNTAVNQPSSTNVNGRQICVSGLSTKFWDREETTPAAGSTATVVSPAPATPGAAPLCGETSVISINNGGVTKPTGSLKATVTRSDSTIAYTDGWGRMLTPPAATTAFAIGAPLAAATSTLSGLPVVGAAFVRAVGGTGTFGATWSHRYTRR